MYAMVGVAAAVVLGTALTAILSTATVSAVLFAATILEDGIATAVGGAAIGTTAGALAIAGTVLIILLAIVTAVLEGIRVFENASRCPARSPSTSSTPGRRSPTRPR